MTSRYFNLIFRTLIIDCVYLCNKKTNFRQYSIVGKHDTRVLMLPECF